MIKKPKLLYIHHGVGIGGAPISLSNLVKSVTDTDLYDITVLFMFNSAATSLFNDIDCKKVVIGKPYLYFNHTSRWTPIWKVHLIVLMLISWIYTVFIRAPRVLKKLQPDLIHLNSSVLTDWSFASRRLGILNIMHIREAISEGHFGLRYRLSRYLIMKFPDFRFFISRENISRLDIKEGDTSVIVYNDIGEKFRNFIPSHSLKAKKDKINFMYLGGLSPIKGLSVIVDALDYLDKNIVIHVAGHFDKAKALNNHPRLDHTCVNIIGLVKDVPSCLSQMDVMLCPITDTHFCRPAIEASSMGIPVIISDIEGAEEMVLNGKTGLHFMNKNAKDLAEKMNQLSKDGSLRKQLGTEAQKYYNDYFTPTIGLKSVLATYKKMLS